MHEDDPSVCLPQVLDMLKNFNSSSNFCYGMNQWPRSLLGPPPFICCISNTHLRGWCYSLACNGCYLPLLYSCEIPSLTSLGINSLLKPSTSFSLTPISPAWVFSEDLQLCPPTPFPSVGRSGSTKSLKFLGVLGHTLDPVGPRRQGFAQQNRSPGRKIFRLEVRSF